MTLSLHQRPLDSLQKASMRPIFVVFSLNEFHTKTRLGAIPPSPRKNRRSRKLNLRKHANLYRSLSIIHSVKTHCETRLRETSCIDIVCLE